MSGPKPPQSVLVAGGGVAALEGVLALRACAAERVSITMLSAADEFRYRPLAVTEPFSASVQLAFRLDVLADDVGVTLRTGVLAAVDTDLREVRTADGERIAYDSLLVATGAVAQDGIEGAVTFWGGLGGGAVGTVLEQLRAGAVRRPVFAVPSATTWPLPLYELALLTAHELELHGSDAEITLVTPEAAPLEVFGTEASEAVSRLLTDRGVRCILESHPVAVVGGDLAVAPRGSLPADAVITLPVLTGPAVEGLPHDRHGFLATDLFGVVDNVDGVYAAGDVTAFPIKQGGLATQQADAAARSIAVSAGVPISPEPFTPVLRGRMITGGAPLFLRAELGGGSGGTSLASTEPLWWPPAKIFGHHLGPFLAARSDALAHAG